MKKRLISIAFAIALITLMISSPLVNAQQSNQGFVAYRISIAVGHSAALKTLVINETAQPASQNGFSIISLAIFGPSSNFSYSRVVNTSSFPEIFPFVPGVTNQSFSYSRSGYQIIASIRVTGTAPIKFESVSYTGNSYSIHATVSNITWSSALNGTLVSTPSGLLYAASFSSDNGQSLAIQLVATNLPLTDSNITSSVAGAAAVGIGIIGAAALAVPFWKFGRKRKLDQESAEEKPSHWVD